MDDGGDGFLFLVLVGFFVVTFGAIGAWLGNRYHKQPVMGFVAGVMCGPIGLLLMFALPSGSVKCKFCKSVLNSGAVVCHKCGREQR